MGVWLALVLCALERIKVPIGEANYLPHLSGANLTSFLKKNKNCVIFCASKAERLDFANFAISKLSPQIGFGVTDKSEAVCPKRAGGVSIVPFREGRKVTTVSPANKPIQFTRWCKSLILSDTVHIRHPDQLREIFDTPGDYVLGIDMQGKPSGLNKDMTFYAVPSVFFAYFKMNVSSGLHVYRSCDRQLVRVTGDVKKYLKSPVVDASLVDITERDYFGGFFIDERRETGEVIHVLTKLAQKHRNAYFSLLSGDTADEIALKADLLYVKPPCFVMFKGGNISSQQHWISQADDIEGFVDRIVAGTEPFNHLNGEVINNATLVYDNYNEVLGSTAGDRVVVFTMKTNRASAKMKAVLLKMKSMINASELSVYSYDLSTNEIPPNTFISDVPTVILYPEGRDKVVYDSDASIEDLMSFVHSEATNKFEIPDFDAAAVTRTIDDLMNPEIAQFRIQNQPKENPKDEVPL